MAKYIKLFETNAVRETFEGSEEYEVPYVSYVEEDESVHYNEKHNYSKDYLTFVALEEGTFTFTGTTVDNETNSLSYSLDNGTTWTALASGSASPTVTTGSKILWKGTCTLRSSGGIGKFTSTAQFDVEGNVMSLFYGDDFANQTTLQGKDYAFESLFASNTNVVSAENLSLPATTLAVGCYSGMFRLCRSLTAAPKLPATTLAYECYDSMFASCTSLTTAPELPATTLAYECYCSMFSGCTSLTTAPELPATTLADYCYDSMFSMCSKLTTAPELPATTLTSDCYRNMFLGCANLNNITCLATDISASECTENWLSWVAASGTFTKAASMTSWTTGYNGIPSGWTVQTADA